MVAGRVVKERRRGRNGEEMEEETSRAENRIQRVHQRKMPCHQFSISESLVGLYPDIPAAPGPTPAVAMAQRSC